MYGVRVTWAITGHPHAGGGLQGISQAPLLPLLLEDGESAPLYFVLSLLTAWRMRRPFLLFSTAALYLYKLGSGSDRRGR